MAITSLVIGIFCVLTLFDDSEWDADTVLGLAIFSLIGLVFGSISIASYDSGKGMAITGVIFTSISLLSAIGMAIN